MKKLLVTGLVLLGCRSEIQQVVKPDEVVMTRSERPAECQVHDFPTATEIPAGAKSLGWVKVPRQEDDDTTFELLRRKVCEMGGDAMSQMRWIRASGASVASQPIELEGNAWALP